MRDHSEGGWSRVYYDGEESDWQEENGRRGGREGDGVSESVMVLERHSSKEIMRSHLCLSFERIAYDSLTAWN